MRLTKYEQETIIIYNKGEDVADVSTYEKRLKRHMENKLGVKPSSHMDCGGEVYKVPKSWIRFPIPPRKLSDKTKSQLRQRITQVAKHRQFNKNIQ